MLKRILKILFGILLLPICVCASVSLYEQLSNIKAISYYNQKYFLLGIVTYLIMHTLLYKPAYLYIIGHELMHVLATWLSFGKVKSFNVSPKGGSVGTNKANVFIALAPYFFPFYTILITGVFFITPYLFKIEMPYNPFIFLIGFTISFHIVLTIDFLKIRQTDLLHAGYLFSIAIIYTINIFLVCFILSLCFKEVVFLDFLRTSYFKAREIYFAIFRQLFL